MSMFSFLQGISVDEQMKDYAHAHYIFRTGNYRLAPKYQFLFYVRFNLNKEHSMYDGLRGYGDTSEVGALVKNISLPKFTAEVKTLNAYNRVNLVQTKLKYDPVSIKFHDDGADTIRKLWYDYYSFYYRDSDYSDAVYGAPHKYLQRATDLWGYTLRDNDGKFDTRLINSIQIYSFHQKKFSEVTLHNPLITAFRHGEHDMAQGNGVMEQEMTLQFETVTYASGWFTTENFAADMLLNYDTTPSTLTPNGTGDAAGAAPNTEVTYQDGQPVQVSQAVDRYTEGGTVEENSQSGAYSYGGNYSYGPGAQGYMPGTTNSGPPTKTNNSVFSKVAMGVGSSLIGQVIRGRNPLSKIDAPAISNLLYQAGTIAGKDGGKELIAAGGLVRSGQQLAKGGIGPGNLGTAIGAIKNAGILAGGIEKLGGLAGLGGTGGKKPEETLPYNKPSTQATTNGEAVARQLAAFPQSPIPAFPPLFNVAIAAAKKAEEKKKKEEVAAWSGKYDYGPGASYSDSPATMNDTKDAGTPSNQSTANTGFA